MPVYEIIVIVFLVAFIGSLFTGYPIAWLLGGLSLLVGAAALVLNAFGVDTFLLTSWPKFG
ncbi:MAG: C4-dicarboxylate ABC transporter, partial [Methylobacterium sp.]|nr:C4-dicarboxylate ABC transporter [Methylobacterium sp.]